MYKKQRPNKGKFRVNKSEEGKPIEAKVRKLVHDKTPIEDGAELVYQDREAGVDPSCNIRTDRWELAAAAMDKVTKATLAKRDGLGKEAKRDEPGEGKPPEADGGGEE